MIDKIAYGFFLVGYTPLVVLPLLAIGIITKIFQLIASGLPQYLLFGIQIGDSINNARLPLLFARLSIISVLVFAILFVISAIRVHFQKQDQANPIRIAMKNSIVGTLWLIGVPIGLFLFNTFFNIILNLILGGDSMPLNKTIFMSLRNPDWRISDQQWKTISDNKFMIPLEIYKNFEWGQGIMLVFVGAAVAVSTLVPFAMGLLTLVQKVFQQFFLFIISPFIAAASISDDGKRMKQFQDMYAAKSFAILGLIISIQMFGVFLTRSVEWTRGLKNVHYALQVLLIFGLAAGGAVAATGISSEVTAFVGESASVRETMSETKNMIGSAMALGGAAAAVGKATKMFGTKAIRGALSKNSRATNFFEKLDTRNRLKKSFKSGKIGLAEFNQSKHDLKAQTLQDKLNRQLYSKQREADINEYDEALNAKDANGNVIAMPEKFKYLNRRDLTLSNKQIIKETNSLHDSYEYLDKISHKRKLSDHELKVKEYLGGRMNNLQGIIGKRTFSNQNTKLSNANKLNFSRFAREIFANKINKGEK
ncbi:Mbov_0396 family ICE element transmembrane protein [Metamycoplasma equirhinis]|uniref:Mbov_0396 family ICE element transmembrane protein n=1 Tax=Metamycoplasma equirhinis TaxID=92402 RepID=UPI003593C915